MSQVARKIYAPLDNLLPATDTIDPTPWLKEIKKIETKLQSVAKSEPTKKLLSVFREMKQNLGGKSEEARAKLDQSKEDFYGYDFEKNG